MAAPEDFTSPEPCRYVPIRSRHGEIIAWHAGDDDTVVNLVSRPHFVSVPAPGAFGLWTIATLTGMAFGAILFGIGIGAVAAQITRTLEGL